MFLENLAWVCLLSIGILVYTGWFSQLERKLEVDSKRICLSIMSMVVVFHTDPIPIMPMIHIHLFFVAILIVHMYFSFRLEGNALFFVRMVPIFLGGLCFYFDHFLYLDLSWKIFLFFMLPAFIFMPLQTGISLCTGLIVMYHLLTIAFHFGAANPMIIGDLWMRETMIKLLVALFISIYISDEAKRWISKRVVKMTG
ncbi:hypothetical protein IC619_001195 [Hazenella sp. IB182353]|uniref:hypothetical protein n=1 Tax=Polycladospora coralii TaxID=2771432 RepID=UPI00174719DA|nr:hypothetical protein [Polycladospora coralii]MBS7529108.1 hypothetical protein [Polycladospora coralii]